MAHLQWSSYSELLELQKDPAKSALILQKPGKVKMEEQLQKYTKLGVEMA